MTDTQVAIINATTCLADEEVARAVPALQRQISEHLAIVWGQTAELTFVPRGAAAPANIWWLCVSDTSDQAGLEGYHDLTPDGLPLGKVFAATAAAAGILWTVAASHELLEMVIDPEINRGVVMTAPNGSNVLYAQEICDPCEAMRFAYTLDGIAVSDFVFPSWFQSFRSPGSTQFDLTQQITRPFEVAPEGYIQIYDLRSGGWQQLQSDLAPLPHRQRPLAGSRVERRRSLRSEWLRSVSPGR